MRDEFGLTGIVFFWICLIACFIYSEQKVGEKKTSLKLLMYFSGSVTFMCAMLAIWL